MYSIKNKTTRVWLSTLFFLAIGVVIGISGCGSHHEAQPTSDSDAIPKSDATPKTEISLFGDEAFVEELLKAASDELVQNAVYVSPDGDDRNTGSKDSPLQSVQKALDIVQPGQTIYLREGEYVGANVFGRSGEEGQYIVLRNYPGETPLLTMQKGSDGAILYLNGNSYIVICGLEIGAFSADIAQGILLDNGEHHIIVRNNHIHDLVTDKPDEDGAGEANAILCYGEGITEDAAIHDICIEGNEIYNNTTGWCEAVSVAGNVKNVNIINNIVYNNTNIGIDFYGNAGYCSEPALDQPRYCVAAGNEIYASVCDYAECAGLYVDGARDIVLENNRVHDCMYGIEIGSEESKPDYPVKNIIVRNNTVYHNPFGGIIVGGYEEEETGIVTETILEGNRLYDNGEGDGGWNGELYFAKCDAIQVKDNIIRKSSSEFPLISSEMSDEFIRNVTFSGNVFSVPADAEEILFQWHGELLEGISAFDSKTGGSSLFEEYE